MNLMIAANQESTHQNQYKQDHTVKDSTGHSIVPRFVYL